MTAGGINLIQATNTWHYNQVDVSFHVVPDWVGAFGPLHRSASHEPDCFFRGTLAFPLKSHCGKGVSSAS